MVVTWAYNAGTNTATASGAGSTNFAALVAADTAGGWGKFTADATGKQILCQGKIIIGDGTNATDFTDADKQISFYNVVTANDIQLISVKADSTLTFGVLEDLTSKTTSRGCSLKYFGTHGYYFFYLIRGEADSNINLYSCELASTISDGSLYEAFCTILNGRVWNCILNSAVYFRSCDLNLYNTYVSLGFRGIRGCSGTFTDLYVAKALQGSVVVYSYEQSFPVTITNLVSVVPVTQTFWLWLGTDENVYLVNPIVDSWTINWVLAGSGRLYRQYTFDLQVTDTDGTAIEDADVLLEHDDGTDAFDVDTDASGLIAQQTVSRGYYNQANGNTLQDYGPFKLTVTKTGYMPYIQDGIILDEKVDWRISLRAQLTGNAAATDVTTGKTFYSTDADTQQTGTYTPEPPGGGFYFPVEKKVTVEKIVEKPLNKTLLLLSSNLILQKWKLKRALLLENMLTAQKINKLTENIKKGK